MATYSPPNSPGSLWGQKKPEELFGNPSLNQGPNVSQKPTTVAPPQSFWGGYNPATQSGQPAPAFSGGGGGELPAWMQKAANSFEEQRKAETRALNMSTAVEGAKAGISPVSAIYAGTPAQSSAFINKKQNIGMPSNYYR